MKNKYSFWKLFKKQWSWKNDRRILLISSVITTLFVGGLHFMDTIIVEPVEFYWYGVAVLFVLEFLFYVLIYQTLKIIVMSLFCYLVTKMANGGDTKAIDFYNEALTWRQ